ncbi:MAG: hypothetical protein GX058_01135 [Firmicutes bacterium]|nr:hypothetical protein [Bacillota bacterium]
MSARKMLIVGGLAMLTLSMVYGSIIATFYLDRFAQERKSALANGFLDQLAGEVNAARYEQALRTAGQHRSSHSHLSNVGLIALAIGIGTPYFNLSERVLKITGAAFLLGGIILPLGVFLEPVYHQEIGSLIAMIGGVLVTMATAVFLVGACRAKGTTD